jgi:thimet oligopeptidase
MSNAPVTGGFHSGAAAADSVAFGLKVPDVEFAGAEPGVCATAISGTTQLNSSAQQNFLSLDWSLDRSVDRNVDRSIVSPPASQRTLHPNLFAATQIAAQVRQILCPRKPERDHSVYSTNRNFMDPTTVPLLPLIFPAPRRLSFARLVLLNVPRNGLLLILMASTLSPATLSAQTSAAPDHDPLHAWAASANGGPSAITPDVLNSWVHAHIAAQQAAITELLAVTGPRTVDNTLRPYDNAVDQLSLAGSEAGLLNSVGDTAALRDKAQELSQEVSAAFTSLALNPQVFHALAAIELSHADAATRHYMSRILLQYRLGGVDRDDATRQHLRELQDKTANLSLAFGRNIQEDVRSVTVRNKSDLDGLPADFLARHPANADGTFAITTDQPDYSPVMRYAASDKLRRDLFLAYNQRGYPANKQVLLDLLATRQQIATTLGYKTWANLATADMMIASAENMRSFLDEVDQASRASSDKEYAELVAFVKQRRPELKEITDSDAGYWLEEYRRTAFDFDSQSVRPYFPYAEVETGVLRTAARLFHVNFVPTPAAPVWDKSVTAFNVFDGDKQIGRIYLDMHPRPGKDKWFSAHGLVPGIKGRQMPEAALICNFSGGESGDPGLMEYNDVVTFFHEFGHLIHFILGGQQEWSGLGAFSVEGDFIEAPSQMLEEFFRDPAILQSFAMNYKTGAPIPTDLVNRMNRASAYGRGRWMQAQLFYANYALDVHNTDPTKLDLDALLRHDHDRFLQPAWVPGNEMYASFTHLTGYTSNYYTYVLDKVIAVDFFSQFDKKNLLDGPAVLRYRRTVLEPGASKPAEQIVEDFLGRKQNMTALTQWIAAGDAPPAK